METVRGGARLNRGESSFTLWTGSIYVRAGPVPGRVDNAVQALRGVGRSAAIGPGDDLPPPDFSHC